MSSPSHFSNINDLSLARDIVEATNAERTHVARSSPKKTDSDTASASSFGSSISLLKNKFHHHHSSPSAGKKEKSSLEQISQKNVLRNQVHIGI